MELRGDSSTRQSEGSCRVKRGVGVAGSVHPDSPCACLALNRFPFYFELKIAFVIWLLSPYTKGSSVLYRKFVHPTLSNKEKVCPALSFLLSLSPAETAMYTLGSPCG